MPHYITTQQAEYLQSKFPAVQPYDGSFVAYNDPDWQLDLRAVAGELAMCVINYDFEASEGLVLHELMHEYINPEGDMIVFPVEVDA